MSSTYTASPVVILLAAMWGTGCQTIVLPSAVGTSYICVPLEVVGVRPKAASFDSCKNWINTQITQHTANWIHKYYSAYSALNLKWINMITYTCIKFLGIFLSSRNMMKHSRIWRIRHNMHNNNVPSIVCINVCRTWRRKRKPVWFCISVVRL